MSKYILLVLMMSLPLISNAQTAPPAGADQAVESFIVQIFSAASPDASCKADGMNCRWGYECCSGGCNYRGTCGSINSCKADGASCRWGYECCTGGCNYRGTCGSIGSCKANGAACRWGYECCSNSCDHRRECR